MSSAVKTISGGVKSFLGGSQGFLDGLTGRQQRKAGDEAKKLAGQSADFSKQETAEEVKRLAKGHEKAEAVTIGAQAGSGIELGEGSTGTYLSEMKDAFAADMAWLKKSGKSKEKLIRKGGAVAQKQGYASSWSTAASSVTTIVSFFI